MSKLIQLTQGYHAIVDDEDYESAMRFKWHARKSVKKNSMLFYAQTTGYMGKLFGKYIYGMMDLHKLIMRPQAGLWIDHINHNTLDCRRQNMRLCTPSQNAQNMISAHGSSQFKGVYWNKQKGKWISRIKLDGEERYLGGFDSEVEAARVYNEAAMELFGEFAYLNVLIKEIEEWERNNVATAGSGDKRSRV